MEQKKRRALCDLKIGESGHVYAVNAADQRMRRHIVDMGITPGTEIRIIKAAGVNLINDCLFPPLFFFHEQNSLFLIR